MRTYEAQARLLLRVLSHIEFDHPKQAGTPLFALKGGTALNFFLWDLPRLSVDIDLTYCPINDRKSAFLEISESMDRLATKLERVLPDASAKVGKPPNGVAKLLVRHGGVSIKVEPNGTIRGTVYETKTAALQPAVASRFEMAVVVRRLSKPDLYGGKICAALDRQHPRDLFDVGRMLDQEGLSDETRKAFLIYLLSHNRPMAELLEPHFKPIAEEFEKEFGGMTDEPVTVEGLEAIRERLVETVRSGLTSREKEFLLSVKQGIPKWDLLEVAHAAELPAIKWKLNNINKLLQDSKKHTKALKKLEQCLQNC